MIVCDSRERKKSNIIIKFRSLLSVGVQMNRSSKNGLDTYWRKTRVSTCSMGALGRNRSAVE